MNKTELDHAQAEIRFLNDMSTKPGLSKLSRLSLQARSKHINNSIANRWRADSPVAKAVLTFRGAPVWGTHGLQADFGALAAGKFSEAIAAVAASLGGPLGERGRIPNKAQNRILITDVALGSFGFEFEEAPATGGQLALEGTSPVFQAFELFAEILTASTRSDEELSEPVSRLGVRTIASVAEFLEKMGSFNAYCTFTTGDRNFAFQSVDEVMLSKARLSPDNIHEAQQSIAGRFLGAFPADRKFEFLSNAGEIIHGRIDSSIEQPAIINQHLDQPFNVTFVSRRVGNGKPRYTLATLPW